MTGEAPIVVRLETPPGPDGFWPRENYFAGGAENGYAVRLLAGRAMRLEPGRQLRLDVAQHVTPLPYTFAGPALTLDPAQPPVVVFQWGGRVVPIGARELDAYVQHAFDPTGTTETADAEGNPIVQRGRRGGPILYDARVVDS